MSLITRHVVKALIRAEDTARFFIIRAPIPLMPGWSLVGGAIKKGEDPTDALFREIKEELRLEKEIFSRIEKQSDIQTWNYKLLGIPITQHTRLFILTIKKEIDLKANLNWEIAESRWVSESDMKSLLGTHYRKLISKFMLQF